MTCYFLLHADTVLAEVNETTIIPRPGGKCSTGYKLCIRGLYNACFTILNGLPPEHRLCTSENVSHLCIDISDRSLNGSVYTVLCPQVSVPDCNISSAVDVLTYNFRLIINGSGKSFLYGSLLYVYTLYA